MVYEIKIDVTDNSIYINLGNAKMSLRTFCT